MSSINQPGFQTLYENHWCRNIEEALTKLENPGTQELLFVESNTDQPYVVHDIDNPELPPDTQRLSLNEILNQVEAYAQSSNIFRSKNPVQAIQRPAVGVSSVSRGDDLDTADVQKQAAEESTQSTPSREVVQKLERNIRKLGNEKQKNCYGWRNFLGTNFLFLREFFSALSNFFSGHGFQTSATRANNLANRVSDVRTR